MFKWALRATVVLGLFGLALGAFGTWRAWQPGADGTSQERRAGRPALELVAPAFAAPPTGPTADAGFDRTVGIGETVLLDGGGSTAPKRKELSFSWTLALIPVGSAAALDDPASLQPSFQVDEPGDYVIELIVTEGNKDSAPDTVVISTVNSAPVAEAGADQAISAGQTVRLDGSASSDFDGDPLSYAWSLVARPAGSAAVLDDLGAVRPSFDADLPGTYLAELIVSDGTSSSPADTVALTTDNVPPVADAGPDRTVTVGTTLELDGVRTRDAEGDALVFDWALVVRPPASSTSPVNPNADRPSLLIDVPGLFVVQLIVDDNSVESAPDSFTITVVNSPPVADAGPDQTVSAGELVSLDGGGSSDIDGDLLSYRWALTATPAGSAAVLDEPSEVRPRFTADLPGTYVAQLIVEDATRPSLPDTVVVTTGNSAPVAEAGPDRTVAPGATVQLDGGGSFDADSDALGFRWSLTRVPSNSSAALDDPASLTPSFVADKAGLYLVQLIVDDGLRASAPGGLAVSTFNSRPVADAGPEQQVVRGVVVQLDGSASSDADSDPLTQRWALVAKPAGSAAALSDPALVNPSFVSDAVGTYVAQLIVSDGSLESTPDTVVIETVNQPPVADAGPDQTVTAGDTVQLDGGASFDPDLDPLAFAWTLAGVPEGSAAALSDPGAAGPSFVADLAGDYVVELVVSDGLAASLADQVTITAEPATAVNFAPVLAAVGDQSVDLGATLTLTLSATDLNGDPLSFLASPLPLPAGAGLDGVSGAFSFTPDETQVGDIALTFIVSDGLATDSESVIITVTGAPAGGVTAVAGRLLDSNDAALGVTTPIVGATVSLLNDTATATSDNNGDFLLSDVPAGDQVLAIDSSTAALAPDGAGYASFREEITLISAVTNVIDRDIFLPRIDPAGTVFIDAASVTTTMVENAPIGVSLEVPPDTAFEADGVTEFEGELSISEVPVAFAPMQLPEQFQPAMLVSIQPTGVTFNQPLAITFPNTDNLPPGSEVDIYSLDAETGSFVIVGTGTVSADGTVIETTSGGITAATWHFPLAPQPGADPSGNNGENDAGTGDGCGGPAGGGKPDDGNDPSASSDPCDTGGGEDDPEPGCTAAGSSTAACSGNLTVRHFTPAYQSLGQARELGFVYNSTSADPRPVIVTEATIPVRSAVPNTISTRLVVAGVDQGEELHTATAGLSESVDETIRQAVQFDAAGFATGSYPYRLFVTNNFDASSVSAIQTGNVLVKNERASPFGAGWTLDGLERLRPQGDGTVMLTRGDGSILRFGPELEAYGNDFSTTAGPELNIQSRTTSPSGEIFLGLLGNTTVRLTLSDLPAHDSVEIEADFYAIRSLDGSTTPFGPEIFTFREQGQDPLFTTTFRARVDTILGQAFPGEFPDDLNLSGTGATAIDSLGYTFRGLPEDAIYPLRFNFPHSANGLVFEFRGQGLQSASDEAWGLDNIRVTLVDTGASAVAFAAPAGNFSTLVRNPDASFTRTLKNGTTIAYDAAGLMTARVDRNGNATAYAYDAGGNLTTITDPVGLVTALAYTGGLLASVTDPAGRVTSFAHDAGGDLVSITDPDLSQRLFAYDGAHRLTSQTSKRGFVTTYDYGFHGRNVQANRPDTSTRQVGPSQVVGLIDAGAGLGTPANPVPFVRPAEVKSTFTDGRGNVTTTELDRFGAATRVTDALARVTVTGRDADSKATQITRRNGRVDQFTYDANGNLLTRTAAVGDPLLERTTSFEYEPAFNRVTKIIDPALNETVFAYDASGNLLTRTDALMNARSFTYDAQGLVLSSTDRNNEVISFTYDLNGNLDTITDAELNVTDFARDAAGNVTQIVQGMDTPETRNTSFTYDARNRVLTATDGAGGLTTFRYDPAGNLIELEDATARIEFRSHDTRNRLTEVDNPVTGVTAMAYDADGNLVSVTDALGAVTTFEYDAGDRVTKTIDALLNERVFAYDFENNLTALTDARGQITSFAYDLLNRLTERTNPLNQTASFTRDSRDNLVTKTDPKGQIITHAYDELNRRTLVSTPDNLISITYDAASNVLGVLDNDSDLSFTYDGLNRIATSSTGLGGVQPLVTLTNTYDAVGNRIELGDDVGIPGGLTAFDHDDVGRFTQLTTPAGQPIDLAYDPAGRITGLTFPNTVTSTLTYDPATGRLSQLTHSAGPTPFADFTYGYNAVGNITQIAEIGQTRNFSYDDLRRLTAGGTAGSPESYTYDPEGNRTASHISTGHTTDIANRLTEDDQFTYVYDANGNLTSKTDKVTLETTGYTYDAQDQLIRIDFPDLTFAEYRYDGLRRRIEKDVSGTIGRYVYDGQDILLEYDGTDTLTARYSHGQRIDQPLAVERGGQSFFYHADHQGSVRKITDSVGTVINSYDYDSFGRIEASVEGIANPFTYTGREFDAESNLYYYRARYYDPQIGRFLSEDPIGLSAGDANLYSYVLNNPVNLVDPNGKLALVCTIAPPAPVCIAIVKGMVEFIVITGGLVGGLVVLSSDVNDEGDRTAKPTDEGASSGAGPQCIGNNPEEKNGRTNTDLPGGRKAAEKLFDELTGGESTPDPETGGLKGANDVRIRTGDDGRVRVDVPADVGPSGKHETIHFND